MNDAELIAAAAIVNAWTVEVTEANRQRERQGNALAYDGLPPEAWKYIEALKAGLSLRGTVPTSA